MKKMTVYECIQHLAETPGKKDKLAFLQTQVDNFYLKAFFVAALDPFTQYHIRKIPEYSPKTDIYESITLKRGMAILPLLSEKKISGNAAIDKLQRTLTSMSYDDAIVLERIIEKSPGCGVSASTVNKVWPHLIPEYNCALCTPYSEAALAKIKYPALAQCKSDGARANAEHIDGRVTYLGRSGKEFHILDALDDEIRLLCGDNAMLVDGEFIVVDENEEILPRKVSNGIVNKAIHGKISQEEADRIRFVVWDIIPLDSFKRGLCEVSLIDRFKYLETQYTKNIFTKIAISESRVVHSVEESRTFFAEMLDRGEEGAIIKNFDAHWVGKRTPDMVKMKVAHEVELRVTACNEGTKTNKGKLGSVTAVSLDGGLVVDVGSGFSKNQREEFWESKESILDKVITVQSNDYSIARGSETYALTHPVFVEIREDKDVADTTDSIKSGFDAIYGRERD